MFNDALTHEGHLRQNVVLTWKHLRTIGAYNTVLNHIMKQLSAIGAYNTVPKTKVGEKSRECHIHKPQPFPDTKFKRKPTNLNKYKSNKRTKSTKISSLFPKRGNCNAKRTEKHKNKMTQGKT